MVAATEAVETAWRVARDRGYETDMMDVVEVEERGHTVDVLLAGRRFERGGGLLVVIEKEDGTVASVHPQL